MGNGAEHCAPEAATVMSEARSPVARLDDVAPGTTKRVTVDDMPVLLCNVDGKLYAIEDICTHDGGELDQGELEENRIVCPRHGATFDVTTGAVLTLPAIIPLRTFEVRIEGDSVYVSV
jgi:3-phenylpropionate/trans-cinnamate dioxygenase ferredoxin component